MRTCAGASPARAALPLGDRAQAAAVGKEDVAPAILALEARADGVDHTLHDLGALGRVVHEDADDIFADLVAARVEMKGSGLPRCETIQHEPVGLQVERLDDEALALIQRALDLGVDCLPAQRMAKRRDKDAAITRIPLHAAPCRRLRGRIDDLERQAYAQLAGRVLDPFELHGIAIAGTQIDELSSFALGQNAGRRTTGATAEIGDRLAELLHRHLAGLRVETRCPDHRLVRGEQLAVVEADRW